MRELSAPLRRVPQWAGDTPGVRTGFRILFPEPLGPKKRPGGPEAARPEPCRDYTLIGRIPARNLRAYWQLHLLPFLMYGVKNTASDTPTAPLKGGVNLLHASRKPSLIGRVWNTASDNDT